MLSGRSGGSGDGAMREGIGVVPGIGIVPGIGDAPMSDMGEGATEGAVGPQANDGGGPHAATAAGAAAGVAAGAAAGAAAERMTTTPEPPVDAAKLAAASASASAKSNDDWPLSGAGAALGAVGVEGAVPSTSGGTEPPKADGADASIASA
jgi:hypothetical protein